MDLTELMLIAQEKINEVEKLFCDAINDYDLDPDQMEDVERIVKVLEALQIECMGIS